MENLKSFEELNENQMVYDKDKLYSLEHIKQRLKKAPAYMREELKHLKAIPAKNNKGEEVIATKISERLFAFLFNKHF